MGFRTQTLRASAFVTHGQWFQTKCTETSLQLGCHKNPIPVGPDGRPAFHASLAKSPGPGILKGTPASVASVAFLRSPQTYNPE